MINEKIVVGPLAENCFIVGCDKTKEAVVIDPGDEADKILELIENYSLNIKYILITHGHVDHVAQVVQLRQKINKAEILMHKEDEFLFSNISAQATMFGLPDPGNTKPDKYIQHGEILEVGELKIKVLHTPGHSPGSVTFQIEDNLFVGDLIFASSIGRTDLPGGDYDTLINSVKSQIFTLPNETKIHPGHGPSTTVGYEKDFNPFFGEESF